MTVALVIGGASCVWDDVREAMKLGSYDGVVACNDVGAAWPGKLDAIVSLHGYKLGMWTERRAKAGYPQALRVISHPGIRSGKVPSCVTDISEWRFEGQVETGSSGLFALKVALIDCGFDRAVLCGVPMDRASHFFDKAPWDGAVSHKRGWHQAMPQISQRARSMSGFTMELLGSPTGAWLSGK